MRWGRGPTTLGHRGGEYLLFLWGWLEWGSLGRGRGMGPTPQLMRSKAFEGEARGLLAKEVARIIL